jgi:hypothetical protein
MITQMASPFESSEEIKMGLQSASERLAERERRYNSGVFGRVDQDALFVKAQLGDTTLVQEYIVPKRFNSVDGTMLTVVSVDTLGN